MMRRHQRGQVSAELAVLFTFAVAGFVLMGIYLQRAAQGSTKSNTDSIGSQFSTTNPFNSYSETSTHERTFATQGVGGNTTVTSKARTDSCSQYSHGFGTQAADGLADECVADGEEGGFGILVGVRNRRP